MKHLLLPMALIYASAATADEVMLRYYDAAPPPSSFTSRPMAIPSQLPRKQFIADMDPAASASTNSPSPQPHLATSSGNVSAQPGLPPNMERGVKDLEAGMEDLRRYTAVMANHIQQNGLRGFLAVPPEIRDQGVEVGRKIGYGIGGIATDAAHDMIVPDRH
ncbi:hypothetical protein [Sulfuricystis multivorans]|uniref:hypothetical protein n=1 Tax=Sulfuricystis multivorans TaxID=2211108 RepID=UPI000F827BA0|nr:hypothetical protein [Sulfuricystis multivorans]